MKRILSLLLVVLLMMGVMPASAFADESDFGENIELSLENQSAAELEFGTESGTNFGTESGTEPESEFGTGSGTGPEPESEPESGNEAESEIAPTDGSVRKMSLSSSMRKEKLELQEIVPKLKHMVPDKDYAESEAVFLAETEEEAIAVAESFGAELSYFEEGVAVIEFDKPAVEIIEESASTDNDLTPVYPNYIYSLIEPVDVAPSSLNATDAEPRSFEAASGEKTPPTLDYIKDAIPFINPDIDSDTAKNYDAYEEDSESEYKKLSGVVVNRGNSGDDTAKQSKTASARIPDAAIFGENPDDASDITYIALSELLEGEIYKASEGVQEAMAQSLPRDAQSRLDAPKSSHISPNGDISGDDLETDGDQTVSALTVTNDPSFANQWFHKSNKDYSAWNTEMGAPSVKVAVIDSGITQEHPDLKANIVHASSTINEELSAEDYNGHGTHVAGIVAAVADNGIGGSGVAPNVKLVSIKALSHNGSGKTSYITAAIYRAVDEVGVNVINMSLGGYNPDTNLENAVNYAVGQGVVVVCAAGNDSTSTLSYPAAYTNSISVSAIRSNGEFDFEYSNYGFINIAAPGTNIYSTHLGDSYKVLSGTSMASPMVAGAAALVCSQNPTWNVTQVRNKLLSSVSTPPFGNNTTYYGSGVLDVAKAVDATATQEGPTEIPAPQFSIPSGVIDLDFPIEISNMAAGTALVFRFKKGTSIKGWYGIPPEDDMDYAYFSLHGVGYKAGDKVTIEAFSLNEDTGKASSTTSVEYTIRNQSKMSITASSYSGTGTLYRDGCYTEVLIDENNTPYEFTFFDYYFNLNANQAVRIEQNSAQMDPLTILYVLDGYTYYPEVASIGSRSNVNKNRTIIVVYNDTQKPYNLLASAAYNGYNSPYLMQNGKADYSMAIKKYNTTNYTKATEMSISPQNAVIKAGSSQTFTASFTPSTATIKDVTWSTDAPSTVATIDKNGKLTVKSDISQKHTIILRAESPDINELYDEVTVTAIPIPKQIDDVPPTLTRTNDDEYLFATPSVLPADAPQTLTVTSSKPAVATVRYDVATGKTWITPRSNGTTDIKFTAYGTKITATCKVTVKLDSTDIIIQNKADLEDGDGEFIVTAGKTLQLIGTVMPVNAANKKIVWSVDALPTVATIDQKGKITAKGITDGTQKDFVVTAAIKDGTTVVTKATVNITSIPQVSSITFNQPAEINDMDAIALDSSLVVVEPQLAAQTLKWTSGNTKVAIVREAIDGSWEIVPVGNGTAKITAAATDGSGKTAFKTVTVAIQAQDTISIVSKVGGVVPNAVGAGKSLELVMEIDPPNAKIASKKWYIADGEGNPWTGTTAPATITNAGKLTIKSTTAPGEVITVKAEVKSALNAGPQDAPLTAGIAIEVLPKSELITSMRILYPHPDYLDDDVTLTSNKGKYNGIKVTVEGQTGIMDSPMVEAAVGGEVVDVQLVYTTSNAKAVTVDKDSGDITAVGKGSATIKATALDGSGKSASYTVAVVSKVTSISIEKKAKGVTYIKSDSSQNYILVTGKTISFAAIVNGDDGELPATTTGVIWKVLEDDPDELARLPVTINSKTGVLSYKKNKKPIAGEVVAIKAVAAEAGSTEESAPMLIELYPAIASIQILTNKDEPTNSKTITMYPDDETTLHYTLNPSEDTWGGGEPVFTSGKPAVATVEKGQNGEWEVKALSVGSTTITATATDGSGKKATCTVKVVLPVPKITLTSESVENDTYGELKEACGKEGLNYGDIPQLSWEVENQNGNVNAYAVLMVDSTAPGNGFVHMAVTNIPASAGANTVSLSQGGSFPQDSIELYNDFGVTGYGGPEPPDGKPHKYYIYVFALRNEITVGDIDKLQFGVNNKKQSTKYTTTLSNFRAHLNSKDKNNIICSDYITATYECPPAN